MSDNEYALSNSWEKSNEFKRPFDYTLKDSGQRCLIRRMDMGDFLKLGVAEELDFMSKALMTSNEVEENAQKAVSSAMMKSENFQKMEHMINIVVQYGVVKPKLQLPPEHEASRQPGQVYVDSVPFNDRLELFSVIFDSDGLSTFREEQEDGVGNVADESIVSLPADEPVAVRPDDSEGVLLQ